MARSVTTDLQPIDRLEEKVRHLIGLVDGLRADRARALDEVARLERELDAARARIGEASGATAEAAALREERDLVRARVVEMLAEIDKLGA
jgi:uncharacterized coiled-coil DUF342 family protein